VEGAFLDGFRGIMLAGAGLALLASLSGWWLIRKEPQAPPHHPIP
jgi:hypothetical protein